MVAAAGEQRGPPAVSASSLPSSSIPGGSGVLAKDEGEAVELSEGQASDEPTKFLVFAHHMYVVLGVTCSAWGGMALAVGTAVLGLLKMRYGPRG